MLEAKQNLRSLAATWLFPSSRLNHRWWPPFIGLAYILAISVLGGLRSDHVLIGALGLLGAYNEKTRSFLKAFFPFILTGVIYDSMRYYYWAGISGHERVAEPYWRDLRWFGIDDGGRRVTPNEYFASHPTWILDVLCGFAYLSFVGEYLVAAFYLFLSGRLALLRGFARAFLVVNVVGYITYFIYPAAPPWYVARYGLGPARHDVMPSSAAAHRFDLIFGTHFFDQIYGRGIDVFGAYPSLHVAYPLLVAWLTWCVPSLRWARVPAAAFYLLMCLSAIYLQHHYMEDVLMGSGYATLTILLVARRGLRPTAEPLPS